MALVKIATGNKGRQAQRKPGPAANLFAYASDVNPIIDAVNGIGGDNATVSATNGVTQTINAYAGKFATGNITIGALANQAITVTNSKVKATSNVIVQMETFSGTLVTNGIPVVINVVPTTGAFTFNVTNVHAANAMTTQSLTFKFIVLN